MMAFERTSHTSLDAGTVGELRDVLKRSLESGSHGEELKEILGRLAIQARERGLHAEQLLLALKDVWYAMPDVSSRPPTEVQAQLLQQLIARCIQEYYSG
jgi:hypothetical protein